MNRSQRAARFLGDQSSNFFDMKTESMMHKIMVVRSDLISDGFYDLNKVNAIKLSQIRSVRPIQLIDFTFFKNGAWDASDLNLIVLSRQDT